VLGVRTQNDNGELQFPKYWCPSTGSRDPTTNHRVVDQQRNDRANYRNKHTVEIEAGNSRCPELRKQEPPILAHDVEQNAFAGLVDDFAGPECHHNSRDRCRQFIRLEISVATFGKYSSEVTELRQSLITSERSSLPKKFV
jgi:hypothetical protein